MKNPAMIIPDAMQAIQALATATQQGGVPAATLGLVHLRASQINGCSVCVEGGARGAKKAGETDVTRDRGSVTVLDATTGSILQTMAVSKGASAIAIDEQTKRAFVASPTDGTVTMIDIAHA